MKKQTVARKVASVILGLVMVMGLIVPVAAASNAREVGGSGADDFNHFEITNVYAYERIFPQDLGWLEGWWFSDDYYATVVFANAPSTVTAITSGGTLTFKAYVYSDGSFRFPTNWADREFIEPTTGELVTYDGPPWLKRGSTFVLDVGIYVFVDFTDGFILFVAVNEGDSAPTPEPQPPVAPPAADEVTVLFNGSPMTFEVPPQIINGRTMVPLRAIFEAMGATVEWEGGDIQTATATRGDTVVIIQIGSLEPTVNGVAVPIDQAAEIVDGRTLAPLRFVAEAFGGNVEWDGTTQTATITH